MKQIVQFIINDPLSHANFQCINTGRAYFVSGIPNKFQDLSGNIWRQKFA